MKFALFVFLLSVSAFASELGPSLKKKTENYLVLRKHYSTLQTHVTAKNVAQFCEEVQRSLPVINQIYEDDQVLIKELRVGNNETFSEYAKHIEENSYSPLFTYTAYSDLCAQGNQGSILNLAQSLTYHLMDIDYLSMTNQLFSQSI